MAKDVAAARVIEQAIAIPIAEIEVGERSRPIGPAWAAALGRIMTAEGEINRTAIEVCRLPGRSKYLLVAGGHRLEGARLEGWEVIKAVVVDADAVARRLSEIAENLWRRELCPLDRAAAVAQLVELHKLKAGLDPEKDGRSVSAKARWSERLNADADDASATIALAYGWADDIAAAADLSRRTIYLDLELHRGLLPDIAAQLRLHPMGGNAAQLRALAKMPEKQQRLAAALIVGGQAKTTSDAGAQLQPGPKKAPTAGAKHLSAFMGAWSRMGTRERRQALRQLDGLGLPNGIRLTFEGDTDA